MKASIERQRASAGVKVIGMSAVLFFVLLGCSSDSSFRSESKIVRKSGATPASTATSSSEAVPASLPLPETEADIDIESPSEIDSLFDTEPSSETSYPPVRKPSRVNSEGFFVERTFIASRVEDDKMEIDLSSGLVQSNVIMRNTESSVALEFKQVDRPMQLETFKQGFRGSANTELFTQKEGLGVLDLLVVIDNSGSMSQEQNNLATKLSPLLSSVQDSDWQIGVITTDRNQTGLRGLIKKSDANAGALFSTAVQAGIGGSATEQGILQSVVGLKASTDSSGQSWVRQNSSVAVLIVSDEDNCSNGGNCYHTPEASFSTYLTNYLSSIRVLRTTARVYGIIWVPGTSCPSGYAQGNVYMSAITASGGVAQSICDNDYTQALTQISADVQNILQNQFSLAFTPSAGTLKVYENDVLKNGGYSVAGKTLTFSQPPSVGTSIRVEYLYGAMGVVKNSFTLQKVPEQSSVEVKVSGAAVANTSYTLSGSSFTFQTAPAENADIAVLYRANIGLNSSFSIGKDVNSESLVVKVNDVVVNNVSYHAASESVVFASPPTDGANISVTFVRTGGAVLRYASGLGAGQTPSLLAASDAAGNDIPVTFSGGDFVFRASDFVVNKVVTVSYRVDGLRSLASFELPVEPLTGSLSVLTEPTVCRTPKSSFLLSGRYVTLRCPLTDVTNIVMTYKSLKDVVTEFNLAEVVKPDEATWEVWVNGAATTSFARIGTRISFSKTLPPAAKVRVRASFAE